MAFENGYNIFDYCKDVFIKFKADRNIFSKALQALQYFQTRNDYPYCTSDLNDVTRRIIGADIESVAFTAKYIIWHTEVMEWNAKDVLVTYNSDNEKESENLVEEYTEEDGNNIVESFKNEYQAFVITIYPLLESFLYSPEKINGLAKIIKRPTLNGETILRFIRNDNCFMDLSVNNAEIDDICKSLALLKDE